MVIKSLRQLSVGIILFWLVLTACKDNTPTGTPLSFGVLAQGDGDIDGTSYPGQHSELFAIQSLADIEQVRSWIRVDAQTLLETVEYSRQFAVVVFQGEQQQAGYGVQVTEVSYLENTVSVFVDRTSLPETTDVGDAIISPYQVIWVEMPENGEPLVTFNLVVSE